MLIVDSSAQAAEAWRRCLKDLPGAVGIAHSAAEALNRLSSGERPRVIVAAQRLDDGEGLALLRRARTFSREIHGVLLVATEQVALALGALPSLTLLAVPPDKDVLCERVRWVLLAGPRPS